MRNLIAMPKQNRFLNTVTRFCIKYTPAVCAYLLAALFIYAAYNKLSIYTTFHTQLNEYPFFKMFSGVLVWAVPAIEIIIAALLLYPKTSLIGLYSSFGLMLAFTVFIIYLQCFTQYKSCSCGGIISGFSWKQHLWFNIGFLALALIGSCLQPTPKRSK